jgi:isocitrate dehydrogenase
MFEAVHGSAPDIAGQNIANPSGLLTAATQMLVHLGCSAHATRVHNAWLRTIEDGVHTPDIYREGNSKEKVGTREFAEAVIARLGAEPQTIEKVDYASQSPIEVTTTPVQVTKTLIGVDVFLDWDDCERDPDQLAAKLQAADTDTLGLRLITNRGVKVWPEGAAETFRSDHWRCRFRSESDDIGYEKVIELLSRIHAEGLGIIKTENLCCFDGKPGFSMGQGE